VLKNIAIDVPAFKFSEGDLLNKDILKVAEPYFNIDYSIASAEDKVQYFYNLLYTTKHIDLGLSHAIHHNQDARNHIEASSNPELKKKVFEVPFYSTIGAKADLKPSDTAIIDNQNLSGSKNWFTNLAVADYVAMEVNQPDGVRIKLVSDLSNIPHVIDGDFPELVGMKMAKPVNLTIDLVKIPKSCIIGPNGYPDRWFELESFKHFSFLSNLTGITQALFEEVFEFSKTRQLENDLSVIKVKLDVVTVTTNWIGRMQQILDDEVQSSEQWWFRKEYCYLFAKKTLLSVLNLSRELAVQKHLLKDGPASRLFRDALSFSSHMSRLDQLAHPWGDKDRETDLQLLTDAYINKFVNKVEIPETLKGFDT
jgi:hypothetical protein